ncbi:hypothetical protein F5J12DRAFT_895973 [Pisolithus orientalis]|uniref:uncharacterized protein n=1 Tax=Pisolithus orientalis TaxID=936130 RepID=UPI00222444C9|nr:uncharacterized protein F5J12DRAFT_895973 [Pisolithus orientalis]KAI5996827.1 hypothetical protein F5J12DRAFT_895973 [Pisolithus orientalis]
MEANHHLHTFCLQCWFWLVQTTFPHFDSQHHIWDLIKTVPQPEESLETIYMWVEDWDKTWASIHSLWNEESMMHKNLLIQGAIAIADLHHPVEQRCIQINNIFKDYQERVELRHNLRLRGWEENLQCVCMDRQQGAVIEGGQETDRWSKQGKGKEKATEEVNELEDNEDKCPPNPDPSKTGTPAPEVNLPCGGQAKQKCSQALKVGRKHKNAGSSEMVAGPSHKWTNRNSAPAPDCPSPPPVNSPSNSNMPPPPTSQLPLFLPSMIPAPRHCAEPTPPPMDEPEDFSSSGIFVNPIGLLDDTPAPNVSTQDELEVPPVINLSKLTTCKALAECICLLENRVDDKEFELTQIHQMLGLLATQVEWKISAVQG